MPEMFMGQEALYLAYINKMAQLVKNLPAMQQTQIQFLGWENPLEKEMATHSSIFAWRIPWTKESGGLQSMRSQRVRQDWVTNTFTIYIFPGGSEVKPLPAMWETQVWSLGQEDSPGEGNGNPIQYSCLENPMDRGAWWATVDGVTKSWTQLSD